ncbi:fatty acyl-CoA reductase wat-like [Zophobas morio]|uniref:fatty acyl-CoA reductase wat-like n=1 Tax=Zophobas morio TaxID=2755281 RepID=UPI0030832F5B
MRAKHGKNPQQRFDDFFDNPCFENINRKDFISKVSFIGGDCKKPDLGLKPEDVDILKNETTCVFHIAANVNFQQTIKESSYNVKATKEMITLAGKMEKLKIFVYVSTAYSNCLNNHIRDEIYQPPIKAQAFLDLVDSCNEDDLENTLLAYLNKWPNNYVVSKCLSEDLIKSLAIGIPTAIIRPAIVTNTIKEPIPGYIDNYHGFIGLVVGGYMGVIQTLYVKKEVQMNLVPADVVCNCILAAAWHTANCKTLTVFNCVGKKISLEKSTNLMKSFYWEFPSVKYLWYQKTSITDSKFWYNVNTFRMLILAYCIDAIFLCVKKPVGARKLCKQITNQLDSLSYFTSREWSFSEDNFMNLWNKMGDRDRAIFPFHVDRIDWNEYLHKCALGIRLYLLKEPITTLPQAKKKVKILFALHYTTVALFYYFLYLLFEFLINKIYDKYSV